MIDAAGEVTTISPENSASKNIADEPPLPLDNLDQNFQSTDVLRTNPKPALAGGTGQSTSPSANPPIKNKKRKSKIPLTTACHRGMGVPPMSGKAASSATNHP